VGDLLKLVIGQAKLLEPVDLFHRIPQGIVGAVGHPLCAVAVDVLLRFSLLHEHHGGGNVENAVGVPQQLPGGVEHGVAAEMGGDDFQPGENV